MAKITDIDNRNKTIETPFVYKNKTFGKFFCQYSVFENEVRFENCIFNEDVVFGDESIDEAFCIVKSDLIFDKCTFLKRVKLDGIQCYGHVIFKNNCAFEFGDETDNIDDVLRISNAEIGIGIGIQDTSFKAGINLSATTIKQVGCQLVNVKFNNSKCGISFARSYFGRELSIKSSNIVCNEIDFNGVSVDSSQGTIQLGGNSYIKSIENQLIIADCVSTKLSLGVKEHKRVISIYKVQDSPNSPLLFVNEYVETREKTTIINLFRFVTNIDKNLKIVWIDENGDNTGLTPVGEVVLIYDIEEGPYYSFFYNDRIYTYNQKNQNVSIATSDDIAHAIFNVILSQEAQPLVYHYRNHRSVPMIYATTALGDIYIAIYDLNHSYKIYKWNYIKCNIDLNLSHTDVGCGLYVRQTEFNVTIIDIHSLKALHEILFEDIIFNINNLEASQLSVPFFRFNNIDFIYKEVDGLFVNYPEDWCEGIKLDFSSIQNQMVWESISASNYNGGFIIKSNFVSVNKVFLLRDIRHDLNSPVLFQLNNSRFNQIKFEDMQSKFEDLPWGGLQLETESVSFEGMEIDSKMPLYYDVEKLWNNRNIIGRNDVRDPKRIYPIHFFKQLDNMYEKYESYGNQEKTWKLRNKMRISRDHPFSAILRRPINFLLLNYGWSPWRIVFWLIGLIFIFDFLTYRCFGMDVPTSIVNGFVEFVPVSFNEPIVEQLHGINPQDPKYGPPLLSFGYSAIVTAYRLVSYTLLSVLIAALAGYFRKKKQ